MLTLSSAVAALVGRQTGATVALAVGAGGVLEADERQNSGQRARPELAAHAADDD